MKKWTMYACVAAMALAAGCGSPFARHISGDGVDVVEVIDVQTVFKDDRMTAQISLENDDDERVRLDYKVTWKDARGMAVAPDSPTSAKQRLSFAPYERKDVSFVAPNNDCADFHVLLMEVDD